MFQYLVRASVVGSKISSSYLSWDKTSGQALHRVRRKIDRTGQRVNTISVRPYEPIAR